MFLLHYGSFEISRRQVISQWHCTLRVEKRLDLGRRLVEAQQLGMLRIEKLSGSSKNLNPFIPMDVFL